jgi:hypothetical protein
MDGDIVNPGDLHGRVLPADEVALSWDGNLISAVVGPNLVEGVSGFGEAVHDALRELADNLLAEAVWIDIDQDKIDLAKVRPSDSGTIQTNFVELYRIDEAQVCAVVGPEDSPVGIFGVAESVHEALRNLADRLVAEGVWVEVTARTEWHFQEISDNSALPDELKADNEPTDAAPQVRRPPALQSCRGISLGGGNYAGCPYGSAEFRPLTGPCDCPVCHGSGYEGVTGTWLPHCDFGDLQCAGFLYGIVRGDQGYIEFVHRIQTLFPLVFAVVAGQLDR